MTCINSKRLYVLAYFWQILPNFLTRRCAFSVLSQLILKQKTVNYLKNNIFFTVQSKFLLPLDLVQT